MSYKMYVITPINCVIWELGARFSQQTIFGQPIQGILLVTECRFLLSWIRNEGMQLVGGFY